MNVSVGAGNTAGDELDKVMQGEDHSQGPRVPGSQDPRVPRSWSPDTSSHQHSTMGLVPIGFHPVPREQIALRQVRCSASCRATVQGSRRAQHGSPCHTPKPFLDTGPGHGSQKRFWVHTWPGTPGARAGRKALRASCQAAEAHGSPPGPFILSLLPLCSPVDLGVDTSHRGEEGV